MLKLNQNIHFVSKVFAFAEDEAAADSCVELLEFYERKWNVKHVAPELEVYAEDFTIKTKSPERFTHITNIPDDEQSWQKYVVEQYYGFLSDTNLILDTTCYSD